MLKIRHYIKTRGDRLPIETNRNCQGVTNVSTIIDGIVYTSTSTCSPRDQFSKSFGRYIAISRLTRLLCENSLEKGVDGLCSMTMRKHAQ